MKKCVFMCVTFALIGSMLSAGQPSTRALSPLDGLAFYGVTNLPPAELKLFGRMAGFAEMGQDIDDKGRASPYDPVGFCRSLRAQAEESGVDKGKIVEFAKMIVAPYEEAARKDGPSSSTAARNMLAVMAESGDRSILPYLEEKSLTPETDKLIRPAAAEAYVKIANVEECVEFLKSYCSDPTVTQGKWLLVQQGLDKLAQEDGKGLAKDSLLRAQTGFLTIMQNTDVRDVANRINQYMLKAVPQYTNSTQRASLVRFATEGNAWVTNTFQPIKVHFDNLPPRKRVDLRKRFPDLPPLPEEKDAGDPLKVALGVGAGLAVLGAVAAWLAIRRKMPRAKA